MPLECGCVVRQAINESQARVLDVGVRRLWDTLCQLDRLLDPPGAATAFKAPVADIDRTEAAQLRGEIWLLRQEVEVLATLLGTAPERRSIRREFSALASLAWADAEDLHPTKLGGYGQMDPEVARTLAPVIERIAALFLSLAQQVK